MSGSCGKRGRGGGGGGGRAGGAGKRRTNSAFHPPTSHRSSTAPGGRLSLDSGAAGPRNRSTAFGPTPSAPSNAAEETFSLVSGNPLHFAMTIRLAPDLVEEIKRAEAHGGTTRIKFDANANNSAGNVINVGSKDFRFTWSRDRGDLCDIYEERQSNEDGNGLLVESGSAWRKVNVQRVLDESTKNHVKMLSEEAERKSKSRKTIVLDPRNPSTKSQVKAKAAVEGNPCKMAFKQPPHKKRKGEPPPARGPPKPAYKSGLSTTTSSKGRHSTSPVSSPFQLSGVPASPFGSGLLKDQTEDVVPTQPMNKTSSSVKETPNKVISSGTQGMPGCKKSTSSKPSDLQCMLITFLMDNQSNGMTLKALEKAVGDAFPNSARKIEPVLKKVATFRAPGKYFLKRGVDIEGFKKSTIESGSSPEENHSTSPTHNEHEIPVLESSLSMRTDTNALEGKLQLNSKPEEASTSLEKVDTVQLSPDYFGEQKAADHSEGPLGIFSDSGSDSESDSSDSRCKSRSRSPVDNEIASGSNSDSENDISSNSEEASDDDVDIMTSDDDGWAKYKLQASENGLSKSSIPLTSQYTEPGQFKIGEKEYTCVTDILEIEKDLPDAEMTNVTESGPIEESEFQMRKLDCETAKMTNNQSDGFGRAPKSKCERVPVGKQDDKSDSTKRQKTGNMNQQQISVSMNPLFAENGVEDKHQTSVDSHYKRHVSSHKRRTLDSSAEDCTRSHQRALQPVSQQHYSRVDQSVVGYNNNKVVEMNSKNQHNITGGSLEAYGDNCGKVSTSAAQQHDTKQGVWPPATKECKMQKTDLVADLNDGRKDTSLMRSDDGCQKRRESSPDEITCSYSKYEKKEPEFRVPIKGFSQYKEYVEEYDEKYEKYCSLKKTLESYRFRFCELGKDLHIYKRKDMERYYEILAQLKDSYCQYGLRHKRLKKIFIVLHEELKHLKRMINDFAASYYKDQ